VYFGVRKNHAPFLCEAYGVAKETTEHEAYNTNRWHIKPCDSGFGGLGVSALAFGTQVAGSNPAEAVGFFRAKKSSARLPLEGE
jgi:hypothetical protein